MVHIYILIKDNIPFYVGKSLNPNGRNYHHQYRWGNDFEMVIIDVISKDEWRFWEQYYISLFKTWGYILENKNKGGGGPEEGYWKGKISPQKGRKQSLETRLKKSNSLKGKKQSAETIKKRADAMRNKPITQEHKNKISKSNQKPKPKDFGSKLSQQRKGNWTIPQHQIEAGIQARNKPTLQYDLNGNFIKEYPSAKLAAQSLGIREATIRVHLGGKTKKCQGYIFKYKTT
jgi:hypothetical protein